VRSFAFVEPESLQAATEILAKAGSKGRLLAGGIDLLGEMKDRLAEPETLVNLKSVKGLDSIRFEADGSLRIGALATLSDLAAHDRVRREFPAIAQAAASVGSPEIRNVGTVGGNLCQRPRCWYYRSPLHKCLKKGGDTCFTTTGDSRYHAILGGGPSFIVHPSDLAPALVACGARVTVAGPGGKKDLALEQFFVLPSVRIDQETILNTGEIVAEVAVPGDVSASSGWRSQYVKFREKDSMDFALAAVAAALRMDGETCREARLVLGGVAPIPWRAKGGEQAISGKRIDLPAAHGAAEAALADAIPMTHNGYKIPLSKTLIRRVLLDLAGHGADLGPA
jgi:xanthine dehydrogenase YagS FAD-binding subunit